MPAGVRVQQEGLLLDDPDGDEVRSATTAETEQQSLLGSLPSLNGGIGGGPHRPRTPPPHAPGTPNTSPQRPRVASGTPATPPRDGGAVVPRQSPRKSSTPKTSGLGGSAAAAAAAAAAGPLLLDPMDVKQVFEKKTVLGLTFDGFPAASVFEQQKADAKTEQKPEKVAAIT